MDEAVATWPAVAQLAALRSGDLSSRDLLEVYLDRIARLNDPISTVVTIDDPRARAACDAATPHARGRARWDCCTACRSRSKSTMETEGIRSTAPARLN